MKTILWICALALAAGSVAAQQQRYQCRTQGGAMYLSDRPCGSEGGMVYYGPAPSMPTYTPPTPRLGEAPNHLKYMSPRCSSLHDAIRTGPSRGLKSETLATMQRDYQRDCAEDEAEARNQLSRDKREQSQQKMSERQAMAKEAERTKQQQQQCDEAKRVFVMKSRRTDLSDGEKADLKRFEESYKARCS